MNIFIAYSARDRALVSALGAILRQRGHQIIDPLSLPETGPLLYQISTAIRSADIVVTILADRNPNVYYELGIATGAGKPTLVAAPPSEHMPVDIAVVPYVQLTNYISSDAQTIARRLLDIHILKCKDLPRFKTPAVALRAALEDSNYLDSIAPDQFVYLLSQLFKEKGYTVNPALPAPDAGYDFAIDLPKRGGLALVVVKKLTGQGRVSVETVRRLLSVLPSVEASLGLVISTSSYTSAAVALAAMTSIVLRTLDEVLDAQSEEELLQTI